MSLTEFMQRIMKTHDTALNTMRHLYAEMGEMNRRFEQQTVIQDARMEEMRITVQQLNTERIERMRVSQY